uniref:cell division protein DamX n=1 Tax=Klebsiella aerogenes TaxID=548 RepID=UPI0034D2ECDE
MDDFKPEDDMKADRNDRRAGRSRQSSERDADPQINFDDLDLEADEGRPTRANKARRERDEEEYEEDLESEEEAEEEQQVERRPRKRKKAPAKPASRQYVMMGVGVLVLLLLIVGVGSALKSPSSSNESASGEKSVNLSGDQSMTADQNNNAAQPVDQTAGNTNQQQPQDVSLPPIASNPTQGQPASEPQGQQRVEVQGDLNNALTQQQGQLDSAVANSTLPTEPATVAPVRNGAAPRQTTERQTAAAPRPAERKQVVIEPKPQSKPQATAKAPVETKPKRVESAPAATASKPVATAQ